MKNLSKMFLQGIVTALIGAVALYATTTNAQTITSNQTGTNNGYYYSFWKQDNTGSVSMTLGAGGNYSTTWSGINNFTAGKGWATGSAQAITFSGSFNGGSNGYLAIYGWTTNPLVEYYIVENHGSWTPPGGTSLGTLTSDGGTYNIYHLTKTNAPCITGNNCNFDQYWSVRTSTRSSGTVTTANHFNAWKSHGLNMGTFNYQILETEGYMSSGSSNLTVGTTTSGNGNVAVTGIKTTSATLNVKVNSSATLGYTISPSNATNKNVTFTSTNNSCATVSASGVIHANLPSSVVGTCTITVITADGSFSASTVVTATPLYN